MPRRTYEHLKLDLQPLMLPFSGFGGGPAPRPIPRVRDRRQHARHLVDNLDAILAGKRDVGDEDVPEKDAGFHLTALARTTVGVQATGRVAEVVSVKGDGRGQRVNLFVRAGQVETLRRRLDAYGGYDERVAGRRPDNFPLFESAGRLVASQLEDLWTDAAEAFPVDGSEPVRWEVWVRPDAAQRVRSFAGRHGVECEPGQADFPTVSVLRVRAKAEDLSRFVDVTNAVFELRACSSLTLQILDLRVAAQRRLSADVVARIVAPPIDAPRVCILDTGVLWTHPLLAPAISQADCHTLNDAWDAAGWNSHGTRVAGLALYDDLGAVLDAGGAVRLATRLESVVVLRPDGAPASLQEALGEVVAAVGLVEGRQSARRVFCLAASDYRGPNDGSPTKLSGSVDQLAWGLNGGRRLFCVAAGNLLDDPLLASGYSGRNEATGIGSPGQALNAITIGGCTFLDEHPHGGRLLCPAGDLSASARTSRAWSVRRATKPDLVYEAGNRGLSGAGGETACEALAELDRLTTNGDPRFLFGTLGETSAATAAVAGMAGRLMSLYPGYWPETIRALLVHSASWTPAMVDRGRGLRKEDANEYLLSMFGWGVPDEGEAARSASDRLTLVAEGSLIPFKVDGTKVVMNECAYHPLPWPRIALQALGGTDAELRVTLSYFVQPDMRAPAARRYSDYPSHRLAFDLKGPDDDDLDAVRRGNKAMRGVRAAKPPTRTERNWRIGSRLRERGTIHHDAWFGSAEDLARQDAVRISPHGGWWRSSPEYAGVPVRYALVVSVRTPPASQDVYQEALAAVPALRGAPIPSLARYALARTPVGR